MATNATSAAWEDGSDLDRSDGLVASGTGLRHRLAEQWAVNLCEPLVPTATRVETEAGMVALLAGGDLVWATAFCSVFLHGIAISLPDGDPWRHLRFFFPDGPRRSPMALVEGAWRHDGLAFGQACDATDLLIATQDEHPESDFVTAGSQLTVPGWFSAAAGALVGVAAVSWRATFHALYSQLQSKPAAQAFQDVIQATSALLHRRRAYLGRGDETLPIHVFTSMAFADRVAATLPPDALASGVEVAGIASLRAFDDYRFLAETVPVDAYEQFAVGLGELGDFR